MGKDDETLGAGVDLQWPRVSDDQDTDDLADGFGMRVNEVLTSKNWCLMQMPRHEVLRQGVVSQAEQLTFECPKSEFAADLLGRNGSGKVCHLQPDAAKAFLTSYDSIITQLCDLIQPYAWHTMGFQVDDRTEGMVWTHFRDSREEKAMQPEPLDDDDVKYGLLESHLHFIQRRKLCCMYFLDTHGGTISLHSKDEETPKVEIDVYSDQLLVFRCDEMTFEHAPYGDFTIYQVWVMDELPEQNFRGVVADPRQKAQYQGLLRGVGTPLGPRVMVESLETCVGGSANSNHQYWNMCMTGTDGFIYIPKSRFETDLYFIKEHGEAHVPGVTSYAVHGGLADDSRYFDFDPEFWNIKDLQEAKSMWPRQRLVLDVGYSCLHQAGYNRRNLPGRNIGVYLGDASGCGTWLNTMFSSETVRPNGCSSHIWSALSMVITASRLNFIFGMRGPCWTVDTACSAGLVSFSLAVCAMRTPNKKQFSTFGTCASLEGCVAGGNSCISDCGGFVGNSAASMLSHEGRSFTFNETADGYARGEGSSLVFARAVDDEAEKDNMVACVIGCCSNQDGRSATITAPNGPAQTACTKLSLKEGNIASGEVNASECHGTGTALGDPIEVGALIAVHGETRGDSAFGMTSMKSNVGHGEDNAGAGGMFKCILMAKYAVCTPNCHFATMNSNLVHGGFPALFDTENVDANLNSFISGVSSFGFGGANAHAEFWAQTSTGSHKTHTNIPLECYDQLTVTCPITMGQIDYLTGEPAVDFNDQRPVKVKADILREEFADYGISRNVYKGEFRFRASDNDDEAENVDELPAVYVCGSWSAWTQMDRMEKQGKSIYTATVRLGNTRCEYFYMCAEGDEASRIYPVVTNASPDIEVKGPSDNGKGKYWIIDGRDLETPEGTAFKISFSWTRFRKFVFWEAESTERVKETVSSISTHIYSIMGSWNSYHYQDLKPSSEAPNKWETRFKISERGYDCFQISRDHCQDQIIYPSEPNTTSTEVPVRGPDEWGAGKYWLVEGEVDEIVTVQVEVKDGSIEVVIGNQVWQSVHGWGRHDYFLKSSTSPECIQMMMSEPGIFKCVGAVSEEYSHEQKGYVDFFQILVDADPKHCFYPALPNALSGKQITHRPDGRNSEHMWLISSLKPGVNYEVTFDLTVKDRRQMVTWILL